MADQRVYDTSARVCAELGIDNPVDVVCPYCQQHQKHPPDNPMVVCGCCGEAYSPFS